MAGEFPIAYAARVGESARRVRGTVRKIRAQRLSNDERTFLRKCASYEGSPLHKRDPNDFGLTPPTNPRPDKTLCDEADIFEKRRALELFERAIEVGLVSEATAANDFPKQLWVVDGERVFEVMYGGSKAGCYHGYPIRRSDPLFNQVVAAWPKS